MSIIIKKSSIYQILFALCVYVPYLDNFELTFGVWTIVALFTINQSYSIRIIKQIICYVAILAIAIIVMSFKEYQAYYIIRDITYLSKPILGFLIGYQLCKKFPKTVFLTVINTALLVAIIHFCLMLYGVIFFKAIAVDSIRYYGGYFSDYEVYVLILLIFHKRFEVDLPRKKIILYTWVIGISCFLYLARTNFIQFGILFLAMKGYFEINKRSLTALAVVITATIIGYGSILMINPKRNGDGLEALLYKIKIAPIEPFKTKINRFDWKDFNDNYRSYENIMTVRQVTRDGFYSTLFGKGLGSQIDLKQKLWLGTMELRYISILHNGYMTVFLKSGLLGLLIYLISIYLFFIKQKTQLPLVNNLNLLFLGTGVFLIFSNWVFMGVYNLRDNKSILLGLLICFRELYIKSQNEKSNDVQRTDYEKD